MRSIISRLVIGTSLFVAVFIILLAVSISYSVHSRAETARFDALKGVVYGILGAIDIDADAKLTINSASLPDEQLNNFNANLYAEVIGNDRSTLWKSNSTLQPLPPTAIRPINNWMFEKVSDDSGVELLRVQYVIAWELDNGEELPFIVHVAENVEDLTSQLRRFDRVLWFALFAVAPVLPLVQFVILRISMKPLRDIGKEIEEIESGHRDALSETVPNELKPLTSGLNALLGAERERHAQYKNLLGDLKHNLKTPLSVLQNIGANSRTQDEANSQDILQQTELMKSTLERYAQRATIKSPRYLSPSISVRQFVVRITQTLHKLFDSKQLSFDINVDDSFTVRMDESDLLEVLGNLLENACKYGASNVSVAQEKGRTSLAIEDDGPGWPEGDLSSLSQRGVRADTQTKGQGIGLAASEQIMRSYGGRLELSRSSGGGARVELVFHG